MNNIKKYMTLGAVLAGASLMVSCDGDSGDTLSVQDAPTADVLATAISDQQATTGSILSLSQSTTVFNVAVLQNAETNLTFSGLTPAFVAAAHQFNGKAIANAKFPIGGGALQAGVVTPAAGNVIAIDELALETPVDGEVTLTDLVLTETDTAIGQSFGTFTAVVTVPANPGVAVTTDTATLAENGAEAPIAFVLGDDALVSLADDQPTLTIGDDVFTVAVGNTLFTVTEGGDTSYYVTNSAAPAAVIPTEAATVDLTATVDAAAGEVFAIVLGKTAADPVPVSGTYNTDAIAKATSSK